MSEVQPPAKLVQEEEVDPVPQSDELVTLVRHCKSSQLDIHLCYQCFGDPTAGLPAVLLIGGLNMQLSAWDENLCEGLVRRGFFVVRFDNRDIGHSTKVEGKGNVVPARLLLPGRVASYLGERVPYSIEDMAKDALGLMDALGIAFAHILGVSMGGMIAQTVALLSPFRVLSLTSIMSTTNAADLPGPTMWVNLVLLRKPPANCSTEELMEFSIDTLIKLHGKALPLDRDYLRKRFMISLRRSSYRAGLLRQAAAIRRCPGRDEALRELRCPTLVLHGEQDILVQPAHGHRTAASIPQSKLVMLKSMGHYLHPAFFSVIVDDFVGIAKLGHAAPAGSRGAEVDTRMLASRIPPTITGVPLSHFLKEEARKREAEEGTAKGDGGNQASGDSGGGSIPVTSPIRSGG